jgi:hypothetical protein
LGASDGKALPAKISYLLAVLILLASVFLILWGVWPPRIKRQTLAFSEKFLAQVGFTPQQQEILSAHRLARFTVAWPRLLRIGETGRVTLRVETDPIPVGAGGVLPQNLAIEGQLIMAGVERSPEGRVRTVLPPGMTIHFYWQVRPTQTGEYTGTTWLYPVFLSTAGAPPQASMSLPLSAQDFTIRVVSLGGLDTRQALVLGVPGFFVGIVLAWVTRQVSVRGS